MGRIKEQNEQIYLSSQSNTYFLQPTFIGLIDIIRNLTDQAEQIENQEEVMIEEFNPDQLRLFNAEAI